MKRTLLTLVFLLSALVFLSPAARADDGVYWSRTATVSSSTPGCVTKAFGSTVCALFPANDATNQRSVAIRAGAAARCCWASIVPSAINTRLFVTDGSGPFGSGQGACSHVLEVSQTYRGRPNKGQMQVSRTPGYRAGLCSNPVLSAGDTLYAPCVINSDCTNYGGGTCVASPSGSRLLLSGMFLSCIGDSGTPQVSVQKVRIINP